MTSYQYFFDFVVKTATEEISRILEERGKVGWELVSTEIVGDKLYFFFKKEV